MRGKGDHGIAHSRAACRDEITIGFPLFIARPTQQRDAYVRWSVSDLLVYREAARLGRLAGIHLILDRHTRVVSPGRSEREHSDHAWQRRVRFSPQCDVRAE